MRDIKTESFKGYELVEFKRSKTGATFIAVYKDTPIPAKDGKPADKGKVFIKEQPGTLAIGKEFVTQAILKKKLTPMRILQEFRKAA